VRVSIDIAIIGAGPAGMSAGQYAARAGLECVIFDANMSGGQGLLIDTLDNYPGILMTNGFDFSATMEQQAKNFGVQFVQSEVQKVVSEGKRHCIELSNGQSYLASAVIVATGAKYATLGVAGEVEFFGNGVSYCATCDGPFFKKRPILVVGAGDTAFTEALFLSGLTDKVVLIHRSDKFRAQHYLVERVKADAHIELRTYTELQEILGEAKVNRVRLIDTQEDRVYEEDFAAVFIFVGTKPQNALFEQLEKNESGHFIVDSHLGSNVAGIYVAGDVRESPFRQVVTACADGALAAHVAGAYVKELQYSDSE
jgi:thioredoxin reductase (NADPH)